MAVSELGNQTEGLGPSGRGDAERGRGGGEEFSARCQMNGQKGPRDLQR